MVSRSRRLALSAAITSALAFASVAGAQTVSLQKQNSISLGTLFAAGTGNGDNPLSVAFDGTNAYVGGFANSAGNIGVVRVDNVLSASTTFNALAPSAFTASGSRGLDSLTADSTGVYMTYDDGAGGGFVRKIDSNGNTLWNVNHSAILGGYRTGALAIDPIANNGSPAVSMVGIGSGRRVSLDNATGAVLYGPSTAPGSLGLGEIINANPGTAGAGAIGSTYRGIAFDSAGNIALSAAGGATYGIRTGQNTITTVTGSASATTPIAGKNVAQPAGSTTFVGQGIAFVEGAGADKLIAYSSRIGSPYTLSLTSAVAGVSPVTGLDSRQVQLLKTDGSKGGVNNGALTGAEDGIGSAYTADIKTFATGKDANGNPVLFVLDFVAKRLDVYGVEPVYTGASGGNWGTASNWVLNALPDSRTTNATFAGAGSATTVTLDAARTVKQVKFDNAASYTIDGSATLTLGTPVNNSDATLPAYLTVKQGNHAITAPIVFASNGRFDIATGSTLSLGTVDAPGKGLTVAPVGGLGSGTLEATHIRTSTLVLNAGATKMTGTGNEAGMSRVADLQLNGGTLDLGANGIIIDYAPTATSPYATLEAAIKGGILSSMLTDSAKALGIKEYGSSTSPTFADPGLIIDSTSVLIRFTLRGDANLDKAVNFDDLLALAQNYDAAATGKIWAEGDFNYDGSVNFDDLLVLAQNYNGSLLSDGSTLVSGNGDFAADFALAVSLVPEPTTLSALAASGLLLRRRR